MRKPLFALAAVIATVLASPSAAAEYDLWAGTRTGMTRAEVAALFPDARKPDYPQQLIKSLSEALDRGKPEYRGDELLRDCGQTYEGAKVCASFFFEDGGLFGVILTAIDTGLTVEDTSALAARFKASIVAARGQPKTCMASDSLEGFDGPYSYCTWLAGDFRVEVDYAHGQLSEINRKKRPAIDVSFMRLSPEAAKALAK